VNPDISRSSFQKEKHYARVILQQGRPLLDADFNEQAEILLNSSRQLAEDIFGDWRAIGSNAGNLMKVDKATAFDFKIGAGHFS